MSNRISGYPTRKDRNPNKINLNGGYRTKRTLKKVSNHQVRKCSKVGNGGDYKRVFDYWWSLN